MIIIGTTVKWNEGVRDPYGRKLIIGDRQIRGVVTKTSRSRRGRVTLTIHVTGVWGCRSRDVGAEVRRSESTILAGQFVVLRTKRQKKRSKRQARGANSRNNPILGNASVKAQPGLMKPQTPLVAEPRRDMSSRSYPKMQSPTEAAVQVIGREHPSAF